MAATARRTSAKAPPIEEPAQPEPVVVPHGAVLRARQKKQGTSPFVPPSFPPGVEPARKDRIAQDEQVADTFAWAGNGFASAFLEGTTFLGFAYLSALAQRAEYRLVSETLASEMTREGIELRAAGEDDKTEQLKRIEDRFTELGVMEALRTAAEGDGFFGRGHLYLDTGDTEDRDELRQAIGDGTDSLSKLKVNGKRKKLLAVRPVEAVWCYPNGYESNDPLKVNWYRPQHWLVMGKEVHVSRLLTFVGRPVPDMLKPAYAFGGLSMSQMLKPYVDNWLRTRQSVADLVHSFSVSGLKTNLGTSLTLDGTKLFDRLDFFNAMRDNRGALVLDKDTEEWFNISTPLGGLDQLQAATLEHIAAVSQIPVVKLLGIQPMGLNASSEGEIRAFYDRIKAYQKVLFTKALKSIIAFIQLSEFGQVDPAITFDYKDLWQLDDAGKAAVEKTRTDIDDANVAMGSVAPEEVRQRIAKDAKSQYHGLDLDRTPAPTPPGEEEDLPDPTNRGMVEPPGEQKTNGLMKPRDPSSRLASSVTNRAAEAGGAGGQGFKGDAGKFEESDHPRGQPGNAGQFGPGGGSKNVSDPRAGKGKNLPSTIYRGSHVPGQEQSVSFAGGVYVSADFNTAKQWGNVTSYKVVKQPHLLDLREPSELNKLLVSKWTGEELPLSDTEYDELAATVFIQGDDDAKEWLKKAGFNGMRFGYDAFLLGKLSDYAKPHSDDAAVSKHGRDSKRPKPEVGYEHPAAGSDHCGVCEHFISPATCALVEGPVEDDDWCKLFAALPVGTQ